MASVNEKAALSADVYSKYGVPEGWITFSTPASFKGKDPGFHATAYYKMDTNEIVIAYRGTELGDGYDRKSDYQMAKGQIPDQYYDALNFYIAIKEKYGEYCPISLTGHSLGGGVPQVLDSGDVVD